jgi:hypothetical protein
MKLKLSAENHVDILTASEAITPKDIAVLKAGITRLFQNGKNKIILELPSQSQESLPEEVIRELGTLDNFARELSGRIVVVAVNPAVRARVQSFAKPPVVLCHASLAEGLAVFAPPPPLDSKVESAVPGLPPLPVLTKEEIVAREIGELGGIRKQLATAEKDNKLLHAQLARFLSERRSGGEQAAFQEKIRALELEIEKLLNPPAKGK